MNRTYDNRCAKCEGTGFMKFPTTITQCANCFKMRNTINSVTILRACPNCRSERINIIDTNYCNYCKGTGKTISKL